MEVQAINVNLCKSPLKIFTGQAAIKSSKPFKEHIPFPARSYSTFPLIQQLHLQSHQHKHVLPSYKTHPISQLIHYRRFQSILPMGQPLHKIINHFTSIMTNMFIYTRKIAQTPQYVSGKSIKFTISGTQRQQIMPNAQMLQLST